jgi:chorismate mutase/prephenate dehydratase
VFRQTRKWLRTHLKDVRYVETESTGKAAQKASEERNAAAIGHIDLAEKYQLNVIAENIEDMPHNVTRFFVLGHNISEPSGDDKTAILCSVADKVGALHDLLSPFKKYKINMTKIESFPSQSAAWQYYFFIDFLGHPDEPHVAKALEDIKQNCKNLRVIGAFPRGSNQ